MLVKLAVALLVLSVLEQAVGSDIIDFQELPPEKPASQKGRLSLQNTAEIQHCLVSAGDVGCGVFECFENNSCEIRGLQEICMTFLHNAGKFDSQGKSFIKDALKCMAHGLRHKFSCISRKCVTIKEMVFQLQRECYIKHNLCSAAKENVAVMVEMIHFQDLFPKGIHVSNPPLSAQPVRGAGEYSPELWRGSQGSANSQRPATVRAELGGAVQQPEPLLLPRPFSCQHRRRTTTTPPPPLPFSPSRARAPTPSSPRRQGKSW
ncbi:stanniocalcin-2a isoform X2 [Poecilia latipinna]|uniref:stanniocalcin-2a isoform X2 n=1 Tax=Poecilia latipinna TaxID=48699 RepID=UPI00072ECB17|nr:PREDICTED: stanniocalcin-2 isoform X2 [Poecilia latipinna]